MKLEPVYIPIRKVDNVRHAYLGLEGTILLFGQRQAAIDSELLIPVELVTIAQGARFKGGRLIAALLCLLLPLVVIGGAGLISHPTNVENTRLELTVVDLVFMLMLAGGVVMFVVFLTMFFFRVRTVRLMVASSGTMIEFYKGRKQVAEIDDFLEQLRLRQGLVGESVTAPVHRPAGFAKEHSIVPRMAALLYLAGLPALITGRLLLLMLPVAVLVWFAYRQIRCGSQPREYRQALRYYLRGDYDDAIDVLENLRRRVPDYLPTYFCLAEACVRGGRFEEALQVASCLASDYPDVARRMETDIWLFKRIDQRRRGTI